MGSRKKLNLGMSVMGIIRKSLWAKGLYLGSMISVFSLSTSKVR